MEVNTKKLGEIYKEWRGNESCYDNGKPVFEADELLDFAEFCLKHEANGVDKSASTCNLQIVMASALPEFSSFLEFMHREADLPEALMETFCNQYSNLHNIILEIKQHLP